MTRRIHRCLTCVPQQPTPRAPLTQRRGYTRHADRVCAACRRDGVISSNGTVSVHLQPVSAFALRLIESVADPAAPTMAELRGGVDVEDLTRGGDYDTLAAFEQMPADQVRHLNDSWVAHQIATARLVDLFRPPRCVLLCCPVAGPHDRSHMGCATMPLLWRGDQA